MTSYALPLLISTLSLLAVGVSPRIQTTDLFPILVDGKWGYISKSGDLAIKPQFDGAGYFRAGVAVVGVNGQGGYIDETGRFILRVPARRGLCFTFSEGLTPIIEDGKWGYMNAGGDVVVSPQFIYAGEFSGGIARVGTEQGYGFIETNGTLVLGLYRNVSDFSEGLAAVEFGNKMGYIDRAGQVVIKPAFDGADGFSEGLASVRIADERGYVDASGAWVIAPRFAYAGRFSEGLAAVEKDGKWGFIDKSGRMIIAPRFRIAQDFSEGLACVQIGERWGYIDPNGKVVVEPQYDHAAPFSGGLARVDLGDCDPSEFGFSNRRTRDCRFGYIDRAGTHVWKPSK